MYFFEWQPLRFRSRHLVPPERDHHFKIIQCFGLLQKCHYFTSNVCGQKWHIATNHGERAPFVVANLRNTSCGLPSVSLCDPWTAARKLPITSFLLARAIETADSVRISPRRKTGRRAEMTLPEIVLLLDDTLTKSVKKSMPSWDERGLVLRVAELGSDSLSRSFFTMSKKSWSAETRSRMEMPYRSHFLKTHFFDGPSLAGRRSFGRPGHNSPPIFGHESSSGLIQLLPDVLPASDRPDHTQPLERRRGRAALERSVNL
jgi:hypothetical protein